MNLLLLFILFFNFFPISSPSYEVPPPIGRISLDDVFKICKNLKPERLYQYRGMPVTVNFLLDKINEINTKRQTISFHSQILVNYSIDCEKNDKNQTLPASEWLMIPREFHDKLWKPLLVDMFSDRNPFFVSDTLEHGIAVFVNSWRDKLLFSWEIYGTFETSCLLDLAKFPFDTQHCRFVLTLATPYVVLGPVTANFGVAGNMIVLFIMSDFGHFNQTKLLAENSEWKLKQFWFETSTDVVFPDSNYSIGQHAVFNMICQRRYEYYFLNWVVPSFILSLLLICTFFFPMNSESRPCFSVSVLLAFTIVQSQVLDKIPESPQGIAMTTYLIAQMAFAFLVTAYSSVALKISGNWSEGKKLTISNGKGKKEQCWTTLTIIDYSACAFFIAMVLSYNLWFIMLAFNVY